jgi:hypothetical protein
MAIRRASDSLSRCDPNLYSNIYDVRKRPDIKQESIGPTRPIHKDTIEISRDKLKEEALSRLRHKSKYVIAQNGFMRIGKYLFMAIAFPPYLLIYGLPKWILIEGLPSLFSVCVWMSKKVQQKMQKRFDAVSRKVVQLTQFIQNLTRNVLIMPIVRLALEARLGIRRMRDQVKQLIKSLYDKGRNVFDKPRLKLVKGFKFLEKRLSQVREKWVQHSQSLTTRLQESIQWVKQCPQLFLGWGQGQIHKLNEQIVPFKASWKNRFQSSQDLTEKTINWMSKKVNEGKKSFKSIVEPIVSFCREKVQPQWQKLKGVCKEKWKQTKDFFHQKHRRALIFLQEKQIKLKQLSYQQFIDHLSSHVWMTKLPLKLQVWLKKWLDHSAVKAIIAAGVRIYSFMGHSFLLASSQVLQMFAKLTRMISSGYQHLQKYASQAKQKVLHVNRIVCKLFFKVFFNTLYYFLLSMMVISILSAWGIRSLAQSMSFLTSKIKPSFSFLIPKK